MAYMAGVFNTSGNGTDRASGVLESDSDNMDPKSARLLLKRGITVSRFKFSFGGAPAGL